jgi:ABC-type Fe3+/spermidine/putrescine transport system ATPase subunit
MTTTGLELDGVDKTFDDHPVLRGPGLAKPSLPAGTETRARPVIHGMSLSIGSGEIVSLLGPSGCGKTTALRMIAGLERPDRGTIQISGRTVFGEGRDLAPEKRNVGLVFQSYAVWPHRTVLENVAYPLYLKKNPRAEVLAVEALALVQLEEMKDRFPHTLSGGQQQRVALARALAAKPELLLFDEPLSNLDAKLREEMRHEVRDLARSVGITSMYVTHDQPEAFAVSDRVAVVLGGRVAQIATPEVLYDEPEDLGVAEFVGRISVLDGVERVDQSSVRIGPVLVSASFCARADSGKLAAGVRPESVALAGGAEAGIEGRILRATFLGDRREIVVETSHGSIRADIDAARPAKEGDTIRLAVRRCRIFRASN